MELNDYAVSRTFYNKLQREHRDMLIKLGTMYDVMRWNIWNIWNARNVMRNPQNEIKVELDAYAELLREYMPTLKFEPLKFKERTRPTATRPQFINADAALAEQFNANRERDAWNAQQFD